LHELYLKLAGLEVSLGEKTCPTSRMENAVNASQS